MSRKPRKQYRVSWTRADGTEKVRIFHVRGAAERRVQILSGPEPWRAWAPEKGPDDLFCCDGEECSCQGITFRAETEAKRAAMPALLSVRLDERTVEYGKWEEVPALREAARAAAVRLVEVPAA